MSQLVVGAFIHGALSYISYSICLGIHADRKFWFFFIYDSISNIPTCDQVWVHPWVASEKYYR